MKKLRDFLENEKTDFAMRLKFINFVVIMRRIGLLKWPPDTGKKKDKIHL